MISIVIITWNSEKYIKHCLESVLLSAENTKELFEVFIIDNGSKDGTIDIIRTISNSRENIFLDILSKNMGTTFSRNLGIRKAKGDYILIIDSDVEMKQDSLKKMIKCFESHLHTGMVVPKIFYPDGSIQDSYKKFPTIKTKFFRILAKFFNFGKKILIKDEMYSSDFKKDVLFPNYAISACWLVKKEVFAVVGLLDENIFYSPEDIDFCIRVWENGYIISICSEASVVHHTQRLSYKKLSIGLSHLKGLFYFFKKHKYLFSRKKLYNNILIKKHH